MSRSVFFQYILIFAVALWPLWLALSALGIEIYKAIRGRFHPIAWKVPVSLRPPRQRRGRSTLFHQQRPLA